MSGELNTSKFNESLFNEGSTLTPVTTLGGPGVFVDWNRDGVFTGSNEDVTGLVVIESGLTAERGKDQIQQLAPPIAGRSNVLLRNQDKLFSIWNTMSPLYGQLKPGRKFQWRFDVNSVTYYLYTGLTQRIPQHPAFEEKSVELSTLGMLSRLTGKKVSTELYTNITTGEALGHLLDAAGWAADERVIDTGVAVLSYWWLDEQDAFTAMQELLQTEGLGASIFEDGYGRIVFQGRTYRQTNSTTSAYTFRTDTNIRVFAGDEGIDDILNSCELEVVTREIQDESVIWTLGESLTLAPGETRRIKVKPSSGDPFTNAQLPDATFGRNEIQELLVTGSPSGGTVGLSFEGVSAPHGKASLAISFAAFAADVQTALENMSSIGTGNVSCSGGPLSSGVVIEFIGDLASKDVELISVTSQLTGGTNPSAQCLLIQDGLPPDFTLASGSIDSITLDRTSGAFATLEIVAGASGATIEGLQLRGQLITTTTTQTIANTIDASASIADYGAKPYKPTTRKEISAAFAQDFCDAVVQFYKDPRANVEIQLIGFNSAILEQQVSLDVSDRITIYDEHSGLFKDFYIEKVKQDMVLKTLITTFSCEEAIGDTTGSGGGGDVALWDTGIWNSNLWGF